MNEITPIRATGELAAVCRTLAKADYVAVDTEFMREATYWPQLCLVQIAGPEARPWSIRSRPGSIFAPVRPDAERAVVKVFHAARQDIEIIYNMAGTSRCRSSIRRWRRWCAASAKRRATARW